MQAYDVSAEQSDVRAARNIHQFPPCDNPALGIFLKKTVEDVFCPFLNRGHRVFPLGI